MNFSEVPVLIASPVRIITITKGINTESLVFFENSSIKLKLSYF